MNTKTQSLRVLAIAAAMAAGSAQAAPNLLVNGDFETFTGLAALASSPSYQSIATSGTVYLDSLLGGSGPFTGWFVQGVTGNSGVDLIKGAFFGAITNVSVDMVSLPGLSFLTQSFNTVAGTTYTLKFDRWANLAGGPVTTQLNVAFGDGVTNAVAAYTAPAAIVTGQTLTWTASSTGTASVTFSEDFSFAAGGNTIDNVSVMAVVPEPETLALMLAGLGVVGTLARRRRNA
jgi:PEP-CTERM motif